MEEIRGDIIYNFFYISKEEAKTLKSMGWDMHSKTFDGLIFVNIKDGCGMFNDGEPTTIFVVFCSKQAKDVKLLPIATTTPKEIAQ
jgi:hypothetical protein